MKFLFCHFDTEETFLLYSPVFHQIKRSFPEAQFYVLSDKSFKHHLSLIQHIEQYLYFPEHFIGQYKCVKEVNQYSFDYIIDASRVYHKAFRRWVGFLKAKHKIGYNKGSKKRPFNLALSKHKENHCVDYYLKVLDVLDIERKSRLPVFPLFPDTEQKFKQFFEETIEEGLMVFIHIEPNNPWHSDHWYKLISNHNLRYFNLIVNINEASELKPHIEKLVNVTCVSLEEKHEQLEMIKACNYVVTTSFLHSYFASSVNLPVLLLAEKEETLALKFPLSEDYFVVTGRFAKDRLKDISFDSVLLAFREMVEPK